MWKNRKFLYASLAVLTLAQAYIINQFLFCAWMTALHAQDQTLPHWQHWAELFEVFSIPIGLLWVTCVVMLVRTRSRQHIAKLS